MHGDFYVEYTSAQHQVQQAAGSAAAATPRVSSTHGTAGPATPAPTSDAATPASSASGPSTPAAAPPPSGIKFVSPSSANAPSVEDRDTPVRRYRALENISDELDADLHLAEGEEPATLTEALAEESWKAAMADEMAAIEENGTWELCDLPAGQRSIGLKWVYKLKKNPAGEVVRHKARLVAKGYAQRAGVDFDEVFAPVARLDSVRVLLALAAHKSWEVHHLDVKSAFLNGDLEEVVYVAQPPGFVLSGKESKVLRLKKALYGLHQAPRAWNAKLDSTLLSLGFQRSPSEHAVYVRGDGSTRLLLGVYVDDLIVTGAELQEIVKFKQEMMNKFRMSDLGLLTYYLGIEVTQSSGKIFLCQSAYANKLLERAGMVDCNATHVPMETRLKMSKHSKNPAVDATMYRSIVGGLRYLVNSRPDIAFAVGFVSRFMENPTTEHLSAVKHLLRYIAGTRSYGCVFSRKEGSPKIVGFSDADHAGDIDNRRSTTGSLFLIGDSPVTWQSQKQQSVALSSCEAEYMAASASACQAVWLQRLLGELLDEKREAVKIFIDNKSAIQLCKNPVLHERSKHIDTRYHFIREKVADGKVAVEYVSTTNQLADILTKALGRAQFQNLRARIGVIDIEQAH
jgi:hypothetical protein